VLIENILWIKLLTEMSVGTRNENSDFVGTKNIFNLYNCCFVGWIR